MHLDFDKRLYTSEVIVTDTASSAEELVRIIEELDFINQDRRDSSSFGDVNLVRLDTEYRQKLFNVTNPESPKRFLPEKADNGNFLYDFFISRVNNLVMLSSPYTQVARDIFRDIDRELSFRSREIKTKKIKSINYQSVDLNKILIVANSDAEFSMEIDNDEHIFKVNFCMLEYAFPSDNGKTIKQSIQIKGNNLTQSEEYRHLLAPVLAVDNKRESSNEDFKVAPAKLGLSYLVGGRKRCSVATDRHGNFRFWVGVREDSIIHLTGAIARLIDSKLGGTSANVPIIRLSQEKASDI